MNIHEYQAKEILKGYGVRIQEGIVVDSVDKAISAAEQLKATTGTGWFVVKSQIHAGGRGKGGGVKLAKSLDEVKERVSQILGMQLITHQTGPEGKKVNKVLISEDVYYPGDSEPKEYYLSILLDRAKACNVIMASTEGGMDIEEVAEHSPEKIIKEWIDPRVGLQDFQARKVAFALGLSGAALKEMVKFIQSLYRAYVETDSSMFEINPVLKTSDDKILAVNGTNYNLDNIYDLIMSSMNWKDGEDITMKINRGGKDMDIKGKIVMPKEKKDGYQATDESKKALRDAWLKG